MLFPALLACSRVFHGHCDQHVQLWALAACVLQPAAVLVDHGHFQYNGFSLGLAVRYQSHESSCTAQPVPVPLADNLLICLTIGAASAIECLASMTDVQAVCKCLTGFPGHTHSSNHRLKLACAKAGAAAAIASSRHLLGSVLYCCALNHKQMALYYAPAFFGHLLGHCLQRPGAANKVWTWVHLSQPSDCTASCCHSGLSAGTTSCRLLALLCRQLTQPLLHACLVLLVLL